MKHERRPVAFCFISSSDAVVCDKGHADLQHSCERRGWVTRCNAAFVPGSYREAYRHDSTRKWSGMAFGNFHVFPLCHVANPRDLPPDISPNKSSRIERGPHGDDAPSSGTSIRRRTRHGSGQSPASPFRPEMHSSNFTQLEMHRRRLLDNNHSTRHEPSSHTCTVRRRSAAGT